MSWTRRSFIRTVILGAGALVGPWSMARSKGTEATADTPELKFLSPSEYKLIREMSFEILPDEPILSGLVDVALNIDRFLAANPSPDFLVMLRYLRLIRLADPVIPIIKKVSPLVEEDLTSFKRMLCFLGYYSDANGEADLPPEQRVVWPRIGYGGPKPEDWWPSDEEPKLDLNLLPDRIEEGK